MSHEINHGSGNSQDRIAEDWFAFTENMESTYGRGPAHFVSLTPSVEQPVQKDPPRNYGAEIAELDRRAAGSIYPGKGAEFRARADALREQQQSDQRPPAEPPTTVG
jgi:hypothetical protein